MNTYFLLEWPNKQKDLMKWLTIFAFLLQLKIKNFLVMRGLYCQQHSKM